MKEFMTEAVITIGGAAGMGLIGWLGLIIVSNIVSII